MDSIRVDTVVNMLYG